MTDPIIKICTVACTADQAFDVFTARMTQWWPLEDHAASAADGKAAMAVTFEPKVGGALYETMHDGSRNEWGTVLEFSKGKHFATTWHPGNNKDAPTRLDVMFENVGPNECRVTLTHSGWEIWAEKADEMRDNYDRGWEFVFGTRFVAGCSYE